MEDSIRLDLYKSSSTDFAKRRGRGYVLLWKLVQATLFRLIIPKMFGWRRYLLRKFGATIGEGVLIQGSAKFTYPWNVTIGDHSWVGENAYFYSLDRIIVGSQCCISQNAYLCTGSHKLEDPTFGMVTSPITIKNGAWVASDVFVFPGVTIHELAVAGARSTVIHDIPPNEVHVGYPAKFLRNRLERDVGDEANFDRKG